MKPRCRCCLATNCNFFHDIFDQLNSGTSCAEIISYLTEVQINQDDGLSQKICSECNDEVKAIYEFTLKVRQADETLRKELDNTKLAVEHEELLNSEYFGTVEDQGMQVCVMEEILDHEHEEDVLMVEVTNTS